MSIFKTLPLLLLVASLQAQNELPVPRNLQKTFDKGTRSKSGLPGPKYWQNRASYDLKIRFEPVSRLISGSEDVVYTNNSPDTLREIMFKLYPNLYKRGAMREMPIEDVDAGDGMRIERLSVDGAMQPAAKWRINGTEMMLRIPPLAPGKKITFAIGFDYNLNKGSHIRTGEIDPGAWFIAYFFPRIAVYDDIDGWNRNPYLGTQEFYNDFCDFKTAVTVPRNYLVWGTGDLVNCSEVLTQKYCDRLAAAVNQDAIGWVVDSLDLKNGGITQQNSENTFRFEANNVTDVALAVSNHYVWQSSGLVVDPASGRRTRVDAVFNPAHKDYYLVASDARKTVEFMSYRFPKWPYPYNHETVFDGLDQMEYPMMVNDNPLEDRAESIELTDHEIFHTMFPFYMGINETKYGWMDEGWATIGEWLISPMIDSTLVDEYGMARYERTAGTEDDLPITSLTTQQNRVSMFTNSYPKPALGYLFVKDMLGDTVFYRGLHHYIRSWNGKHPMPYDFFNCMNAGSGVDLNWFWKRWFFDDGIPDLAIGKVSGSATSKKITIESRGTKPVPVDLTLTFDNGAKQNIHRSIAVWKDGNRSTVIKVKTDKPIKMMTLGSTYVPDSDKSNNTWKER